MSKNCNDITKDLKRGGLDQSERVRASLAPDQLRLMNFGLKDWMQFAYHFSKDVLFFDTSDDQLPSGNWEVFFKDNADLEILLEEYQENNKLTPHLTLFICFIKLLDFSKARFNQITTRHLDFYYEDILQISKLEAEADHVYLLFELAKNVESSKIPIGTEFDGDKDAIDKKRIYTLTEQFIANKSKIASIKSIYNAPENNTGFIQAIKASPFANSADGLGKPLKNEPPVWFPFGYKDASVSGFEDMPNASLGFAVSGNTLLLQEGKRFLVFIIQFSSPFVTLYNQTDLLANIHFSYTTEDGWTDLSNLSGTTTLVAGIPYTTKMQDNKLFLFVELTNEAPASVSYNPSVHGQKFKAIAPIFKFSIQTETETGYKLCRELSKKIVSISVKLKAEEIKTLSLESDTGTLNAEKPFYPFTTLPAIGSNFTIYNPEIFSKKWLSIGVNLKWQNTPVDFGQYYKAYDQSFAVNASKNWLKQIKGVEDDNTTRTTGQAGSSSQSGTSNVFNFGPIQTIPVSSIPRARLDLMYEVLEYTSYNNLYNSIVTGNNYFKANIFLDENKQWNLKSSVDLFQKEQNAFYTKFHVVRTSDKSSEGLKLSLLTDFLHNLYPTVYTLALSSDDPKVLIPNQPYTPFAEYIELNYEAEDDLNLMIDENPYNKENSLHLYQIYPFGEREEHIAFAKNTPFSHESSTFCSLIPDYETGGELLIGIENASILQEIHILFQFLEGSENPLQPFSSSTDVIQWSVLCSNYWKKLDITYLTADPTENFLQSGIVKLILPEEASDTNTLLPSGLFWIRVKTKEKFDAFCQLIGISAQASLATFDDRTNELSHLLQGLPAHTITKMINRSAQVKKIEQPYNSFGGKLSETQQEYYLRVSERLRHKNRAIALWDYEHLVLQKFTEIFRVKCLNHACECSYLSGGNVTVIVIPNTQKKNVFDIFQPRVSNALLLKISNYLAQRNSLHVKTHVINPDYEEVKVSLEVEFRSGFDIPFHLNQMNKDIQKYLSPWAFDENQNIQFGIVLHRSQLVNYIDELPYVDYVSNLSMSHNGKNQLRQCQPSSPKAILVSAKSHDLKPITNECERNINQTEETC